VISRILNVTITGPVSLFRRLAQARRMCVGIRAPTKTSVIMAAPPWIIRRLADTACQNSPFGESRMCCRRSEGREERFCWRDGPRADVHDCRRADEDRHDRRSRSGRNAATIPSKRVFIPGVWGCLDYAGLARCRPPCGLIYDFGGRSTQLSRCCSSPASFG
jgi:hypothetical protein